MPVCRLCSAPYDQNGAHDLCQACELAEILKPEHGSGESFGPYEIVCPIGEGGLAVVYLAEQIQPIHREVALKVMKQGDTALALGGMELQAMARLEHPHIARLIDAGTSSAGRAFLVMEFVDGLPITEYCDLHALTVRQRLVLFVDICRALQYAHGKGILHRDIKPSNILVAVADGKAVPKIIDFGVAKSLHPRVPGAARTQVAQLVGTPEYMSPEQADLSSSSLGPTSDVYSLGMVLYELLCGTLPFTREGLGASSLTEVLRILRETEAPSPRTRLRQLGPDAETIARRRRTSLNALQHELSGDLASILQIALAKHPGDRYSSPAQLSDEIERYLANQPVRAHGRSRIYRWRKLMQRRRGLLFAMTGSALFAFASFLAMRFLAPAPKLWSMVPFSSAPGYEQYAAMSPNGREVAFAWDGDRGPRQIYIQTIASSSPTQLLKDAKEDVRPAWSPDGSRIAYVQLTERGRHDVYIASSDGSKAHKLTSLISYEDWLCNEPHLDWSPDGSELVAVEQGSADSPCRVVAVDAVSGTKRFLSQPPKGSMDVEPAFSPDGESIAFLRQSSPDVGDLFVIRRNGSGPPRRITFEQSEIRGFSWTADGKAFICSSRRGASFLNLWRFPVNRASPVRLTESAVDLGFPSVAKTGLRIACMSYRDDANIWRYRDGANEQLIASVSADMSAVYSPDARNIAFVSNRTGNFELWITDADGKDPVQLTTFGHFAVGSPSWSPHSLKLAFDVRMAGHSEVYVVDAEPGRPAQRLLVNGLTTTAVPTWSGDGRFLYFGSRPAGIWNVYRVPVNGGDPVQITHGGGLRAIESADGKYLYFKKNETGIWRVRLDAGGPEEKVSAVVQGQNWAQWCLGPGGLYFLPVHRPQDYGPVPIEVLRPGSQTPEVIGRTEKAPVRGDRLAVSGDGASFLYSQLDQRGSSILLLQQ